MLHKRIQLLKAYLTSLPPSYLTSSSLSDSPSTTPITSTSTTPPSSSEINHPLLRSILALLSRLPLLLPTGNLSKFNQETLAEKSDVELVSLLGDLGKSVKDAREMGHKFYVVDRVRSHARKGGMGSAPGGMGDSNAWDTNGYARQQVLVE